MNYAEIHMARDAVGILNRPTLAANIVFPRAINQILYIPANSSGKIKRRKAFRHFIPPASLMKRRHLDETPELNAFCRNHVAQIYFAGIMF